MIKHAYIFTVNGNLPVVNTCLQMLDCETNDFYILCDAKWKSEISKDFFQLKNSSIIYLGKKLINWGGYSQVSAVVDLLKEVINSGVKYSYVHFLQGADLPIKSNDEIVSFFEDNYGKEFIDVDVSEAGLKWAEKCCQYKYFFCNNRFYQKN